MRGSALDQGFLPRFCTQIVQAHPKFAAALLMALALPLSSRAELQSVRVLSISNAQQLLVEGAHRTVVLGWASHEGLRGGAVRLA